MQVETIAGRVGLAETTPGTFTGTVLADADGFLAIAPHTSAGESGVRRLIGLTVRTDAPPQVRIVSPGRDLRFPGGTTP